MTGENDTPPGIPGARRSAGARTGGDGGLAAEAAVWYQKNAPKGEFVLVIRGAESVEAEEPTLEDGLTLVNKLREEGLSLRDAVRQAAKELGLSRNQLYDLAVDS